MRRFTTDVGKMQASVSLRADIANGEIQKIQQRIGRIRGTVRVGLRVDETSAAAARTRLDELTRDRDLNANVGVRLDIAAGEVQKLQQRIGRIRATVRVGLRLDEPAVTAAQTRLDELTRDRTVTITTRTVGGAPGGGGGSAGGGRGALVALATLAPALAPIAARAAAVSASVGAAAVAVGVFGVAVKSQLSALSDAADAQKKYKDAVDQYGPASQQAAKAQQELARTLATMPPASQRAAAAFSNLKSSHEAWSDSLSQFTMVPVTQGIGVLQALLPKLSPLVKDTSVQFTRLTTLLGGGINSGAFDSLMARFTEFADGALTRGVDKAVHLARVLAEGGGDGAFSQFMAYAKANGPLVEETLGNLAAAVTNILKAAGEAGPGLLSLVNAFAQLVAAVPPSVLATLLQVAAAMKLIALTRAGILATTGAVAGLTGRLTTLSAASAAAGGGLAGLRAAFLSLSAAAKGTIIVAALVAVGVAVAKLASLGREAPPDVDQLSKSLGRLGETGKVNGEALKAFGADLGELRDKVKSFVDPSTVDNIQQTLVKIATLGTTDSTPVKEAKENFEAIDKALASLVQNGNADLAAAALEKLKAAYAKGGQDVGQFSSRLTEYKNAIDDAKFAQELAAQSQGLFGQQALATKQTLDAQKASADGLRQSLQALNDVQRSALDGQIGFQAAIAAATRAAEEHGRALSVKDGQLQLGTQKARDQAQALSDLAAKTDEAAATARENGASWQTVNGIYEQGRKKLIEVAQQMGLDKDQAKQLADQILKIPDKTARVKMEAEDARRDLDAFIAAVKRSPGAKSVTLKTLSAQAEKILEGFGYKVTHLKDGSVTVSAKTGAAVRDIGAVQAARDKLSGKTITITTRKVTVLSTIVSNGASSQADALRRQAERFGRARGGPVRRAAGGPAQYFGEGGYVDGPGTPTSDSILATFGSGAMARVSTTEYVVQASAVRKYGVRLLDELNAGRLKLPAFAKGGLTQKQKAAREKEQAARREISGQMGISYFGKVAGYQRTPLEKALGKPADLGSLVSSLNGLRGQIKTAFHGKTESSLLKQLDKAGKSLIKYDKQLTAVTSSLAKAKDKLNDLKTSAKQLKESVASAILSGSSVVTQAPQEGFSLTSQDVVNNMRDRLAKTQQFTAQLETLKKRGLSADLLEQIASAGVDQGGATATALAGASDATLKQLNQMQSRLKSAANAAGSTVSDSMYGAGIRAAEGLVKGLEAKKKAIESTMMAIALSMEKAIRRALGIKSPSTVMARVGDFTALGFAQGVDRSRKHAVIAAQKLAMSARQGVTLKHKMIAARGLAMSMEQGAALTGQPVPLPAVRPDAAPIVHHYYEPHITVEGHVMTERNLRDVVEKQMLRLGMRNPTTYAQYKR
ncbi:phage tail protein [Streptomyces cavernae]|uniref:phage tail protein n=1 Tax=Streptomyces cavernae TaxID=2259034 RepID=UPI001EE4B3C7|nr:phage tail protein [Streptomyces cavernae]